MINKKIVLGKTPEELGVKDAVHVAIVSVRASLAMEPGSKCLMNENGEAYPSNNKSIGIADPFLKGTIKRGQNFLLILNPDAIDNVQHIWDHPKFSFAPPTTPIKLNRTLEETAKQYGVTYEQLMEAMQYVYEKEKSAPYPGTKTEEELDEINDNFERWDVWSEWAGETLVEFDNIGSECCPKYCYPEDSIFRKE